TGLQLYDTVGDVDHPRRNTVRSDPVDDPAVAGLPEEVTEAFCPAYEQEVEQFVEIPLVEQEGVKPAMLRCEVLRHLRIADIELVREQEADKGDDDRRQL